MKLAVTWGLCFTLLLIGVLSLFQTSWIAQGALQTDAVQRGEFWRIFTSIMLHLNLLHLNLLHLWLNLMLLCFIGFGLEPRIGHGNFLFIFLAGGISGGLLHLLVEDRLLYALGASGGIYALLCALIVILHRARLSLTRLERIYLDLLVALAFGGIVAGLVVNALPDFPFRAGNAAHIGGGVAGLVLGWWVSRQQHIP